jgi:hypothetical protein
MVKLLKKLIKQSEVRKFVQNVSQDKHIPSKIRPLGDSEVDILKSQGNFSENWSLIQVSPQFDPTRVRNSTFGGVVILPAFFGTVCTPDGLSVSTGIDHCQIYDSVIENCHLSQVATINHMMISQGCVVRGVGSLSQVGLTHFGIGRQLSIGSETGGRTLASFPEMNHEIAWEILSNKDDQELQTSIQEIIEEFAAECACKLGFLDQNVIIQNTQAIRNSWIGAGALIDGATKIRTSVILSSLEQPTIISDGAVVEKSALQWGTKVSGQSIVSESIIQEASEIGEQAHIHYSYIASNSIVCRGQVVSSLLGPFTGFRHQGLLISVLWPEGRGNVAQGVNIGSNHTGRQPDQECFLAKGCFFGLGSQVQFPLHLLESPWALIAAGTRLRPQRIEFPFALLTNSGDKTMIRPGWIYGENAFMLTRCEKKFSERNHSRRHNFDTHVLEESTTRLVLKAVSRLQNIKVLKQSYSERDIPGLGGCLLNEIDRQNAITWYLNYLERYALYKSLEAFELKPQLLDTKMPVVKEIFRGEVMKEISKHVSFPAKTVLILKQFRTLEKHWKESIIASLDKDFDRGENIQEDYSYTHPTWDVKNFWIEEHFQAAKTRCQNLIDAARE